MKKYYDRKNKRLVFCGKKADSSFWDQHWQMPDSDFEKSIKKNNSLIIKTTGKFLKPGTRVLEGGCGNGAVLYALHQNGYKAYGIDYAAETVKNIQRLAPELNVRIGDVRNLPVEDEYFAGYWSLGVIEHFYDGFEAIIKEVHRTLEENGYLFLTFPYMNFVRRYKARKHAYEQWDFQNNPPEQFYQFALSKTTTIQRICDTGFKLCLAKSFGGVKGFKDEFPFAEKFLQFIYDNNGIVSKVIRKILNLTLSPFAGHCILLVFRKTDKTL